MHIRSQQLGAGRGASMDTKTWAVQEYDSKFNNLETMARFQQKQLQEKEQKLLQLYDQQQQRAYQVVQRGSAGSNASNHGSTAVKTTTTAHTTSTSQGGKVRQMFDERRQTTVKGIDRSYPLEPLENKLRKQTNTNGVTATQRNGNFAVNRQSVSMKRMARADVNSNVNGGKPVVSYQEEITRESFGPFIRRHDDEDEFGIENRVTTFADGHHHHRDADNEQDETLDQEALERNRMLARIHLMGFDETLKHRVRNDLESEEFPEYLMVDVPDKPAKRNITKKLSQSQARLERFKTTIAKKNNVPKQPISPGTVVKKRSEQIEPGRSSFQGNGIAGTSPTSLRSGSRISERNLRILANVRSPLPATTRLVDEMSKRRRRSFDVETLSRKDVSGISSRKITKRRNYPRNNEFKSLSSDGKIFIRRSPSPQFFCTESERSGTTMSIDRKSIDSRSASPGRITRSTSPQFFCRENEQSATTMSIDRKTNGFKSSESDSEKRIRTSTPYFDVIFRQYPRNTSITAKVSRAKSPEWDTRSSSKGSASPRSFSRASERSNTAVSIDGGATGLGSPDWSKKIFAKSETAPRYSPKQYARSETSMSTDRKSNLSESPLFYRKNWTKRSVSPHFFLHKFEQSRRTNRSKSPIWNKETPQRNWQPRYFRDGLKQTGQNNGVDGKTHEPRLLKRNEEMLANPNTQYFDEKHRASTIFDRKTTLTKSPSYEDGISKRRSASPQFFCKESERSGTTMTIDRAGGESRSPSSYDREMVRKQSPSPQFFGKETEKSATTTLMESRSSTADSAKGILRKPNYMDVYKRSTQSLPSINKRMSSTQDRYISKPLITKREVKRDSKKDEIPERTRRSSKISETSATSGSSIVNLKYGLEFDNIFQSAELVRKFMKSQKGEQRQVRQSTTKRNIRNVSAPTTRDIQLRSRYKTSPLSQKTRSRPEIQDQRRTTARTPESPRKSITPTEVDMEIQEIIMTDHHIERDIPRNAVSPVKRQIDKIFADSGSKTKFKTSILTYPGRKSHKQRVSILEPGVFRNKHSSEETKRIKDHRSDRDSEESAISLSKLDSPTSETSRHVITRAKKDRIRGSNAEMSKTRQQTWDQSAKNRTGYIEIQPKEYQDRQRTSSRSPNQMRRQSAESRLRSSGVTSSDSFRREQRSAASPILREGRSKTLPQPTRLVQGALKDKDLSSFTTDKYNQQKSEYGQENRTVDETDAGIDAKYRTIVDTALNKKMKDRRKIISPKPDVFLRKGARISTITPKKIIPPKRGCSRQHDIKSSASSRALSSRQTPKISRDTDISQISVSQRIISKADRSSSPKFLTYTAKNRKESVLDAKETAKDSYKINIKDEIGKSGNTAKKFSKALTQREDRSKSDFGRMDSVESALKRFDSIGVEFERSSPASCRASSEISLQMINAQPEISAREPITSQESTTVDSREVTKDRTLKPASKCAIDNDLKGKKVARKSDSKILGKEIYSSKGLAETESLTGGSKQRSAQTRSPTCKRQLFRPNMEKENSVGQPKSSYAKARKSYPSVNVAFRKNGAFPTARSPKDFDREITRESKKPQKTLGFSVKPLRSIEDIRRSIDKKQSSLAAVKESRSAIANRRLASREAIDAKGSISATDAARNIFTTWADDPIRLTKVKSCVSRSTKSPSPDVPARKQHETNAARTTRGNVLSSPIKSPDITSRRVPTDSKNQETRCSRKPAVAKGADSIGNKTARTAAVDVTDGVVLQNGSLHESPTKRSDAFVIDLDDQPSKEGDTSRKQPVRKPSDQQIASRGSGRPVSSSSSTANSPQSQASNTKARMATKISNSSGPQTKKTFPARSSGSNTDNLVPCSICKRNFAQDRISHHETICAKTTSKKRKLFNTKIFRTRGTELEPFVKEGFDKKQESKIKKPEVKSDWRRKHEDFITTIRYAKQVQEHVAAGGNLNDISPPPPSDTSDYIQCPHCGRKFNQGAAERHIPKCENMRHNKPAQPRGPRSRR